ncbi:MAG TPA: phage Gp37/Gp68 family protein [Verrucomicrobia bacterium]|nr:phage Gp37/Gp68 family protein [Verrucomicrobiota bacterium]
MNKTGIEYLTHTWNPIAMRCTPISEGCAHCWHLRTADRMKKNPKIRASTRVTFNGGMAAYTDPRKLDEPFNVKSPAIIGVQFMGDLFHENIPFEWIRAIFARMLPAAKNNYVRHTFLLLTKRPARMAEFMAWVAKNDELMIDVPLPNVWLGVTVENQARADERIPILLQIPAAVRFVSVEPMLGPVDLRRISSWHPGHGPEGSDALSGGSWGHPFVRAMAGNSSPGYMNHSDAPTLDWVVCGAETGPGKREMKSEWAMDLRDQCGSAGVPFFFKKDSHGLNQLEGRTWEQMP